MRTSTVTRRRLISPFGLFLVAAMFALAFFLFNSGMLSRLSNGLSATDYSQRTDQLVKMDTSAPFDMTRFKSRKAANEVSDDETGAVIMSLLREQRVEEAQQLLDSYPSLKLDTSQRLAIDLELAATESPAQLAAVLSDIADSPVNQTKHILERAIDFSKSLQQPGLTSRLYYHHAEQNQVDSAAVFQSCGHYMLLVDEPDNAMQCFQSALNHTDDSQLQFEINLSLLRLATPGSANQTDIIKQFMDDSSMTVHQLSRLAPMLLAIDKPESAYRIFARLAINEPARAAHWLPLAARWAEEANRPVDAAVFLDALVKQVEESEKLPMLKKIEALLVGAGQSKDAYQRIKSRLEQPRQEPEELRRGIRMANELGDQRQAMSWNQRLLDMYPNDYSALTLQVDLALATSNLPVALQNVKQLVRVSPDDPEVRTRIARISEWNGELAAAVLHWHWLTDRRNQSNEEQRLYALRQLVRLSALNNDVATAARAQRELSLLTDPDDQLVSDLVSYFVQDGRPKEASVALNDLLIVHGPLEFAIRRLADHEYSYGNYRESLAAWNQLEQHHGRTSESILHRVELLWRLDRKADAVAAAGELQRRNLLSQANDYQVRLLAEIAWQYDMQWLGEMVGPRILSLDKRDMRAHYGRRAVQALRTAGNDQQAIEESVKLWRNTGDEGFAIGAMSMALKVSDQNVLGQFSPGKHGTEKLQSSPDYWVQLAAVRLRDANNDGARAAYLQALELDTQSADAAAGLIWLDIGSANSASLQETINTYRHLADDSPVMWQAMAVAYLQLGAASTSLSWFEKSLDQIRTDYGMLLTYADALEYAGMAAEALRVREYTLNRLRPLLVDATEQERDLLLRQYAKLSARYAGVSHSDELVNYLLGQEREGQAVPEEEVIWREDIAISWLMSSQQLEQARVVMANLHSKRLQAPVWQHMALALKDNDSQAIKELVQASGPLSIGNHILALRQLGNDKEAYGLAQMALNREHTGMALTPSDLEIAAEQYAYLRQVLPSFVSGEVSSRQFDQLSASERGFHIRHSVTRLGIGFGLRASERTVDSQRFMLDGLEHRSDVALSLYLGNSRRGASITSGFMSTDRLDVAYAQTRMYQRSADRRRELALEMAYNEPATQSPELLLAGLQHRVSLSIDTALGRLPYARFQTDATQIRSREDRLPVADGLSNQIELGLRGSLGRHQWSTSVQAGHIRYDRRDELPEPLRLSGTSSMDSVLAREVQSLSVGGFIERGGVNRNFPTISSPRYFLNARVHHYWPRKQFGFQLGAGAGIRVLGGDELSFTVNHDTQALQADPQGDTSLGVNYRYHF